MHPSATLQPPVGYSLQHKTSSTSIRSLLNDPVDDSRHATRQQPSSADKNRHTPTREQRPRSPLETPRIDTITRYPSPGAPRSASQLPRYAGQDRKVSRGSEGSSSRESVTGMERPVSSVSDASSHLDYSFPTSNTTANMPYQQPYLPPAPPIAPDMYSTMPSKAIQTNGSSRAPISRATKACNACRSRKVRCDAGGPKSSAAGEELACTRCKDSGVACVYTGSQRKRGPAPGANRPSARRKPSSLELETETTLGLGIAHDMSRTRSASSLASANGHYHPYAPVGTLPSPPSAYRGMSHSAKQHPSYLGREGLDYPRAPQQVAYDRNYGSVSRGPMTAPLPGGNGREFDYRHSISGATPYQGSPVGVPPHGYPPHEQLSRHPLPPHGVLPDHMRPRRSFPDVDPALQAETSRPSTGLSGWQRSEPKSAGPSLPLQAPPPPPPEQDRAPRAQEAAAYQAGYEAALREARIAAKVEVQREELERREKERLALLERDTRIAVAQQQQQQQQQQRPSYEDIRRNSYWERYDVRDPARDKMEGQRERERESISARTALRSRELHFGEIDTRVTLPPIQQMDR